jgi:putative NADPH-quinone reductase
MKVLIIFAHPNPLSFTRAILDNFVKGLKEAGHQYEVVLDTLTETQKGNRFSADFF